MEVDGGGDGQKGEESPSPSMGLARFGLAVKEKLRKVERRTKAEALLR